MPAFNLYIGAAPEIADVRSLAPQNPRKAVRDCAVQGPRCLGPDLFFIGIFGVVIAEIFVYADALAALDRGVDDNCRKVVIACAFRRAAGPAFHFVVHAAAEDDPRTLRPVAQNNAQAIALSSGGMEHTASKAFGEPRVVAVDRHWLSIREL